DALEIEDQWIGRGGGHSDHPDLDRSIVDVDAGRGRTDRRADSAYGHIGLMTVAARRSSEGKPGRYSGDVVDAANVQGVQRVLVVSGNADRDSADRFSLPCRGNDDLLHRGSSAVRLGQRGVGNGQSGADEQ